MLNGKHKTGGCGCDDEENLILTGVSREGSMKEGPF